MISYYLREIHVAGSVPGRTLCEVSGAPRTSVSGPWPARSSPRSGPEPLALINTTQFS